MTGRESIKRQSMNKEEIIAFASKKLDKERWTHTEGVRDFALALCAIYGEDKEKALIAAVCHDLYRRITPKETDKLIDRYGISEAYRQNPALAHGKIAAAVMKAKLGIEDQDVLNAVSFHTTGRARMSLLEKIIFIADSAEPGRKYKEAGVLREMAIKDIDRACLEALDLSMKHLQVKGTPIDHDTIEAYNDLAEKSLRREGGETDLSEKEDIQEDKDK